MERNKLKIKGIVPINNDALNKSVQNSCDEVKDSGTRVVIVNQKRGCASIESYYDEEVGLSGLLKELEESEKEGYDGLMIMCAADGGLQAAKSLLKTPVVGILESCMHLAAMLGRKFSIVTMVKDIIPVFEDRVKLYGLESKCASVRAVEIPVLDLEKDIKRLHDALYGESKKAIEEDGADVVILGCVGMTAVVKALTKSLGIPVLDPNTVGLKMNELVIKLGLKPSRRVYMPPRKKVRIF